MKAKKIVESKQDPDLVTVAVDLNVKMLAVITVRQAGERGAQQSVMNDKVEISRRSSNVPGYHYTGDRFAEHRVVTIGGGTGAFSLLLTNP